jgi:hypothetical protein
MIDLYLFNTIINTIWYLFTVLFVLYRFTSLFSYGYNFLRFCGKLFNSLYYVYDRITIYIKRRNGYEYVENQGDIESQNSQPKTLLQSCKTYLSKQYDHIYYKIFGKRNNYNHPRDDRINLAEITITNNIESFNINKNTKDYENELFDQQMNELSLNSSSIELNCIQTEVYEDSNEYDPLMEQPTVGNSELDAHLFDKSSCNSNRNTRDVFHNVNLNNDSFLNNNYFNTSNDTYTYSNDTYTYSNDTYTYSNEPVHLIIKDKLDTIPENFVNFKVYEYEKEQAHTSEIINEENLNKSVLETIFEEPEPNDKLNDKLNDEINDIHNYIYGNRVNHVNHVNYGNYSYIQDDSSDELCKEILKNPYI